MSKLSLFARLLLAAILGLVGFLLAGLLPLEPKSLGQARTAYTLLGFFFGFLIFTPITRWLVKTLTQLLRLLVLRIASELINQVTHLTSSGVPFIGGGFPATSNVKLSNPIVLDTSAIIDGRVLDVAKAGFLSGIILVPNFVLTELQQVADSPEGIKRARGRAGFEVLEQLKKLKHLRIEVWDKDISGKNVDEKLLRLGKILKGKVLTVDFNLNKVATVSGVDILNINELANAIKTLAIPGEKLKVKLIHPGKDKTQGVGYLSDGTMVVVRDGVSEVGETLEVEVTKILQIPAGRMIFAQKL